MKPIYEEAGKPRRPPTKVPALGALASQAEATRGINPASALRAVVAWSQAFKPERMVLPLRTGLPCWLGFQALQRGWPLTIVVAPETLDRSPDDVLPLLIELALGADERHDVGSWKERDAFVVSRVPILDMSHIVNMTLPKMEPHVVQPHVQEVEAL